MARIAAWMCLGLVLLLAGCRPAGVPGLPGAGDNWEIPFPADTDRQASATFVLTGAEYHAVSAEGTAIEDTALRLMTETDKFKWGMYSMQIPHGATDLGITINAADVSGTFYVAAANYSLEAWEWHGPFTESAYLDVSGDGQLSPLDALFWAVAAGSKSGLLLLDSQVSFEYPPLEVPPAGQSTIATLGALPSLVHLPMDVPTANHGAPVVAYQGSSGPGSSLSLAYYRGGSWERLPILPGRSLSVPQLIWASGGAFLITHDTAANTLVALRYNLFWQVVAETELFDPPGGHAVAFLDADLDAASGMLGILHSTSSGTDTGSAWYTSFDTDATTGLNSEEVYAGETVAGLSVAFDQDGRPWAGYTHGTWTTEGGFDLDFTLDLGTDDGNGWAFAPLAYADDPLYVDMDFDATGRPQVLFTGNRVGVIDIPLLSIHEELPVMFDVLVSRHNGTSWDLERVFESTFEWSVQPFANPPTLTLELNLSPLAVWSRTDELGYNRFSGDVVLGITNFDPIEFEVQSGTLVNSPAFMTGGFGSFTLDPAYFNGADGINFSWAEAGTNHGSAYVANSELDLLALLGGDIQAEGELLYWRR